MSPLPFPTPVFLIQLVATDISSHSPFHPKCYIELNTFAFVVFIISHLRFSFAWRCPSSPFFTHLCKWFPPFYPQLPPWISPHPYPPMRSVHATTFMPIMELYWAWSQLLIYGFLFAFIPLIVFLLPLFLVSYHCTFLAAARTRPNPSPSTPSFIPSVSFKFESNPLHQVPWIRPDPWHTCDWLPDPQFWPFF